MNMLLQIGLSNVLISFALALLAWFVSRLGKNQHVAHALWLLVLVKLITPPVWSMPTSLPNLSVDMTSVSAAPVATIRTANETPLVRVLEQPTLIAEPEAIVNQDTVSAAANVSELPRILPASLPTLIAGGWILTSTLWALVVLFRIVRFQRMVQTAESASANILERTDRLAKSLGLTNGPDVRVLTSDLSPAVWRLARRRTLLLPGRVVAELTAQQLDTVITHELAHLARRDDLVRFLEAWATCLFWWNPVVWWARRELRAAEEDCCDAVVVCSLPNSRQQYGAALLRVAEMISFGQAPPVLATPFGQQQPLKRRIEMILTQRFRRTASWRVKVVMLVLAITVLPIATTAVSSEDSDDLVDAPSEPVITSQNQPVETVKQTAQVSEKKRQKDIASSVVAHWRFQQGLNGDVADSSRLIKDSSGNDRHGRAVGEPKYRSVNNPGSNLALTFDGGDDRVFVPDDKLFHLTKSFTLEAYIQIDSYPGSGARQSQIVFRGDERRSFDPWFLAVTESGQLKFMISDALDNTSFVLSPEPIPTGKLLHVAAKMNDKTGKQSLFINGKRVATTKSGIRAFGPLGGPDPGIGIGNRQSHSDNAFCGTIDELRISAIALSPSQFLPPPSSRER